MGSGEVFDWDGMVEDEVGLEVSVVESWVGERVGFVGLNVT